MKTKNYNIRLESDQEPRIKEALKRTGLNLSQFIRKAIDNLLNALDDEKN